MKKVILVDQFDINVNLIDIFSILNNICLTKHLP